MLAALAELVDEATAAFDAFDYARALERTERFFWQFCDNYVELVKGRAYGGAGDDAANSAAVALRCALSTLHRLFAPVMPFVTEEVWSWWHDDESSVHRAAWPENAPLRQRAGDPLVYAVASDVIGAIRKAKSEQNRSLATPVKFALVRDTDERLGALDAALGDVREAGKIIGSLDTDAGEALSVKVELSEPEG
jgi:valyl-tRNA synthetase